MLIPGIIAGIICLVLSMFTGTDNTDNVSEAKGISDNYIALSVYTEQEEKRLADLINSICSVTNTNVMLSFECGSEYVYENKSLGNPLLIEEHPPVVSGIAIVCKGGNDPSLQMKIIELVCALYGVPSSRVGVAGS